MSANKNAAADAPALDPAGPSVFSRGEGTLAIDLIALHT